MNRFRNQTQEKGYYLADASAGQGTSFETNEKRAWVNQFLPPELSRGLFSFIIEHTQGKLPTTKDMNLLRFTGLIMLLSIPMMQMDLLRFTVMFLGSV